MNLNSMNEDHYQLFLLDKLILEREDHFMISLCTCADQSVIHHLKNDLDFLREKRVELNEKFDSASESNSFN